MLGEWYLPPGECQVISTITEGTISISQRHSCPLRRGSPQPPSLLADKSHALQCTFVRRSGGLNLVRRVDRALAESSKMNQDIEMIKRILDSSKTEAE